MKFLGKEWGIRVAIFRLLRLTYIFRIDAMDALGSAKQCVSQIEEFVSVARAKNGSCYRLQRTLSAGNIDLTGIDGYRHA